MLAREPGHNTTVFVAFALTGGIPIKTSGKVKNCSAGNRVQRTTAQLQEK
jgi:hypothetical protein